MSTPIWQPSPERIANSNMQHFIFYVNSNYSLNLVEYSDLYQWSIQNPAVFWQAIWQFCGIIASQPWQEVIVHRADMPGAKWFTGAKLNFAENLLRNVSKKDAIVFCNERGDRRNFSYTALRQQVSQLASGLRKAGVKVGDRIAGLLPNIPETVIAMLATTSLGAIWSSCSTDFGLQGICDRFQQISPKILITTDGHFYNGKSFDDLEKIKNLQTQLPSLEKIVIVPYLAKEPAIAEIKNAIIYKEFLVECSDSLHFEQLDFDHPIYILFSSGTTGAPKCIVHGAGNTLIQHLKELVLHTDLKSNDVIFYYTTCGWMMWNWLISSLAASATILLYDGSPFFPAPEILFDLIDQENISIFGTSAKFISAVEKANLTPHSTHKLNSLRSILSTGSPLLPMNYDFVYQKIKKDVALCSISGGTDIVSCFALGNPLSAIYRGELQCRGLGLNVQVLNEEGKSVKQEKGELVCTAPFPSMPIYFWNDPNNEKYFNAYFNKFSNVWAHGDYAEITEHDGLIIYGRSDAVLNPGGVRIGTAEIYRQVEKIAEITESIVVGQDWQNDVRIILFVKLQENIRLTDELQNKIKKIIRENASPHHMPAKIIQVADIPRTVSGKIVELAVRNIIHNKPVKNINALANPEALEHFKNIMELKN